MAASRHPNHSLHEQLLPSGHQAGNSSSMTTTFNNGKEERADLAEQSRIPTLWGSLVDAGTWQQVGSLLEQGPWCLRRRERGAAGSPLVPPRHSSHTLWPAPLFDCRAWARPAQGGGCISTTPASHPCWRYGRLPLPAAAAAAAGGWRRRLLPSPAAAGVRLLVAARINLQ
jgi:hypothetical protein